MSWIESVDVDLIGLISNFAPRKYKSLNPFKISNQLGNFDKQRWQSVMKKYRVALSFESNESSSDVLGEYFDDIDMIELIMVNDSSKFELIQSLMHEMVHVNQFNSNEDQYWKSTDTSDEYYSLFGEVQAYAHCIFLEIQNVGHVDVPTMQRFNESSHQTKSSLYRQIYRWENRYSSFGVSVPYRLFS